MICLVAAEHSRDPYKQIFMLARFSLSLSLSHIHTHTGGTYKPNDCKTLATLKNAHKERTG